MKLITRDTDYAIRALVCIAGENKNSKSIVTVKMLSDELDMPQAYLRKILQILNKKKILKSFKGRSGGFVLVKATKDISIFELVEIFQGPFFLNEHLFKGKMCPRVKICYLRKKIDGIEGSVIKELKNINISELVEAQ